MKILADLHIHSIASGHAYSTVEEIARAAAETGLEMVALTDHGPAMPGGPHEYYFGNLRILPHRLHGVEILQGVEANIMDDKGLLDLREVYLKRLDIILAGFHSICMEPGCREYNTAAMVNALKNPYVDIIVHPGNPDYPIDAEEVVRQAKRAGKALEINNSSFLVRQGSRETCLEIARLVRQYGAWVSISSDAHFSSSVGEVSTALQLALDAGIPENCILNLSAARVTSFLASRGRKRFVGGERELHE
jgi:putative hydrolase